MRSPTFGIRRSFGLEDSYGASRWPRWILAAVAGTVLVFLAAQLLAGAVSVGVNVDEPAHLDRFEQWLDTGWYVQERYLVDGTPAPQIERATPFVYGAAFSAVAHAANVTAGNETWGEISRSAEAYAVRHLVVAALGLVAASAVGLAVNAATSDRLAALWSASAILAIPAWTGHSMLNIKDIPAATGYTLLTTSLIICLSRSRAAVTSPWRDLDVATLAASGMFLAVGTRTAMWVPLALSLVTFVILAALAHRNRRVLLRAIIPPLAGSLTGLLGVVALYPNNAATPVRWLTRAVADSSEFSWSGYTLTAGELLSERPPLWYWGAWLGASVPVLIAILTLLGIAAILVGIVTPRESGLSILHALSDGRKTAPLLALQQAMLLPMAVIVTRSIVYTGLRQHLYILPALAIMAGPGVASLLRRIPASRQTNSSSRHRWPAILVIALLTIALIKPVIDQTMLYPYNYVYINAIAGKDGINGRWETDYWGVSNREALRRVPNGSEVRCSNWLVRPWAPERGARIAGCGGRHSPFMEEIGLEATSETTEDIWVVGRVRAGNLLPEYCTDTHSVTRRLRGEEVMLGFVLTCNAEAID